MRRLKLAAFSLLGIVIAIAVTHMITGMSIELVEFIFSPWFVVPGFVVAWLLVPRIFTE